MAPPAGKTRLAIVGASVRAAVQSALRAGIEVVGADLFADTDVDNVQRVDKISGEAYPDALADWLATQSIDAWMCTGALENYPTLVDRMATIAPLWGVHGAALRRCRDPGSYEQLLFDAGVAYPMTLRAEQFDFPLNGSRRFLAKTYHHAAGAGVWRLTDNVSLERAIVRGAWAQDCLEPSIALSAQFAVGKSGASLLGMTKQLVGRPGAEFAYVGSVGPVIATAGEQEQLEQLGVCLAERLELRGLVGVDLVAFEEQLAVVEINPRYTASIEVLERGTGRSSIEALQAAWQEEAIVPWDPNVERIAAKRIVFAEEATQIDNAFINWMGANDCSDCPRHGESIAAGSPVCTVFADGTSLQLAEARVESLASEALAALKQKH